MLEKIHIVISMLAGIFFTIGCLILDKPVSFWLSYMILVLTLFLIIGLFARKFFLKYSNNTNETIKNTDLNDISNINSSAFHDEE